MKDKSTAMNLKRMLASLILSIALGMVFLPMGIASADLEVDYDSSTSSSDESSGDISATDCADLEESLAGIYGCNSSEEISSFVNYDTGQFEGPDASGYDEALTQTTTAKDFIQTVVNFALGFLGLVATVIIIYGGVLYVTSRGDENQAGEGKKAISYAVIGIVIILGSFAIVNTLIGATGADTSGQEDSIGSTIAESGESFDVSSVLKELTSIAEDYVDSYKTYKAVEEQVAYLMSVEIPLLVTVTESPGTIDDVIEFLGELAEGTDSSYEDTYALIDENDIKNYADTLKVGVVKIQGETDGLSNTYEAAQNLYNYLKSGTTSYYHDNSNKSLVPLAYASSYEGGGSTCVDFIDSGANTHNDSELSSDAGGDGLSGVVVLTNIYTTSVDEIDTDVCAYISAINDAAELDFQSSISDLGERMDELSLLFEDSDLTDIQTAFDDTKTLLVANLSNVSVTSASHVSTFVKNIDALYKEIKNIKFVSAKINASTTSGNAPLIVRFDSLGSTDPSNESVLDENTIWDFGDSSEYSSSDLGIGASVNHTYEEPGTYRVKVFIKSSDSSIAAGVAYKTIKVSPRSSIIKLSATPEGGSETDLADFSLFPILDKQLYKVTENEATSGITFDACDSTDGSGAEGSLASYAWDFGDDITAEGSSECSVTHAYGKKGSYELTLTVIDSVGVKDNKYVKIYVGSPAARITFSPESGLIGDKFRFSGAGSTYDVGTINSYQWSASLDGESYQLDEKNGIEIDSEFDAPGIYEVSLTVSDTAGGTDTDTVEVLVESQAPVAKFDYEVTDESQPGTWIFDATDSYDPDPTDTITYTWEIEGDENTDWKIVEEEDDGQTISVQFLTTGTRKITLTVADNHEGDLQKTATAEAEIEITTILDVALDVGDAAYKLDENGEAEAEFIVESAVATEVELDYGDGETAFSNSFSGDKAEFTHIYKGAGIYNVTATVRDEDNNKNEITRRIYVGAADEPLAVINVSADGEDIGFGDTLTGSLKTVFTFDASSSVNVDGGNDDLSYSWNFGDQKTSTNETVTHTFDEINTFEVTLTVTDKNDSSLKSEASVTINIEGLEPEIKGISIDIPEKLVTPLKVDVLVDASDEDGKITQVKGWYYDLNDSATELGTITTQNTSFTLTINTKGEENDTVKYGFAVEVKDNDGNTVTSEESLNEGQIPTLEVTNGPNKTPVASFKVDRSSIYLGDEIILTSDSKDEDGEIVSYTWDMEDDGFSDNKPQTEPTLTYKYSEIHPQGVEIRLKVEDDAGATAVTEKGVVVYVEANSEPPVAAFLTDIDGLSVKFTNNSTIDTENGAEFGGIYWDFDTSFDEDGDGKSDNDSESLNEENPTYTYEKLGSYGVKMTIVDTTGQSDIVEQDVNVIDTIDPVAGFTFDVEDNVVEFTNTSTTDTANDVDLRSYSWDFDTATDSDGDTIKDNDTDAATKNPTYTYTEYGAYKVKLSITDTYGKTASVTKDVELESPEEALSALFTSSPEASSGKIEMTGTNGYVTFYFNGSGGSGKYSYVIDKNVFYDTSGDGERENDADMTASKSGSWKTYFDKSYGQIVARLTVTDTESGKTATATLQVTFQGSTTGANLFNATPSVMTLFILSALVASIAGTALVYNNRYSK